MYEEVQRSIKEISKLLNRPVAEKTIPNLSLCHFNVELKKETKVARRLINLMNFGQIRADFAIVNRENIETRQRLVRPWSTKFPGAFPPNGDCGLCDSPYASYICKTCVTPYTCTFYCNGDCQAKDWFNHRHYCNPLPRLCHASEIANEVPMEEKPKRKFIVPSIEYFKVGDSVIITHFDGRVLYIRPALTSKTFNELMKKIEDSVVKSESLENEPEKDDTILARDFNGFWRRAEVEGDFDLERAEVQCFFLDYGYDQKVSLNNMKKLKYELRSPDSRRHTFRVCLKIPISGSPAVRNYFNELRLKEEELEVMSIHKERDGNYVALKRQSGEEINRKILKLAHPRDPSSDEKIFWEDTMLTKLSVGTQNIKICVTNAESLKHGRIACYALEHHSTLHKMAIDLNRTVKQSEAYKPMVDELCLVKNENFWERAKAVYIDDKKVDVLLVDKLIFKSILSYDVRKLESRYSESFFTHVCYVEGINERNFVEASEIIKSGEEVTADSISWDEEKKCFSLSISFPVLEDPDNFDRMYG